MNPTKPSMSHESKVDHCVYFRTISSLWAIFLCNHMANYTPINQLCLHLLLVRIRLSVPSALVSVSISVICSDPFCRCGDDNARKRQAQMMKAHRQWSRIQSTWPNLITPDLLQQFRKGIWMQQCSFFPLLSFTWTGNDVRLPGLESATAASESCEWGGGQHLSLSFTHTHTHTELRFDCTDFCSRVTVAKFRLHLNKGIHPHTPHLLTHGHINLQHTLILNLPLATCRH